MTSVSGGLHGILARYCVHFGNWIEGVFHGENSKALWTSKLQSALTLSEKYEVCHFLNISEDTFQIILPWKHNLAQLRHKQDSWVLEPLVFTCFQSLSCPCMHYSSSDILVFSVTRSGILLVKSRCHWHAGTCQICSPQFLNQMQRLKKSLMTVLNILYWRYVEST